MLDSWIQYADGFILVYSIDDNESYDIIKSRYERIKKSKHGQAPCIIMVGNKCDLVQSRKIDKLNAENDAKSMGIKFIEASALEKINVKEAFFSIAKELLFKSLKVKESVEDKKKPCYCF
jgi:Ras-related protein Rab-1A